MAAHQMSHTENMRHSRERSHLELENRSQIQPTVHEELQNDVNEECLVPVTHRPAVSMNVAQGNACYISVPPPAASPDQIGPVSSASAVSSNYLKADIEHEEDNDEEFHAAIHLENLNTSLITPKRSSNDKRNLYKVLLLVGILLLVVLAMTAGLLVQYLIPHVYKQEPDGSVRLVNGNSPLEGRVEFLHEGVWGTVCDDSWGSLDAKVVCRQLGYGGNTALGGARFGQATGPTSIWLDGVKCDGTEMNLANCSHNGIGVHDCSHKEDAGVSCTEPNGSVRLVNGSSPHEGRVEIIHEGVWGTVCDDSWGSLDAQVVCQQLGYSGNTAMGGAQFRQGTGPIWLDEVRCNGTEMNLAECSHNGIGVHDCSHKQDAGVSCTELTGLVRLVNGSSPLEGRVEFMHEGVWGTVCDDSWGSLDAQVVCRQLGYGGNTAVDGAHFGQGTGPTSIWLDEVKCNGTEMNLAECSHNGISVHDCSHKEDAGVSCTDVDLTGNIISCSASSQSHIKHNCQYAYDGTSLPGYYFEWVSGVTGGVGSWMNIILSRFYVITRVRILQRCHVGEQVRTMRLMFSDSSSVQVNLGQYGNTDWLDCTGVPGETFSVTPTSTNSINFTIIEVYNDRYNGIREIELWGY